jgi:fructose-bisphosphate aldolase, class I
MVMIFIKNPPLFNFSYYLLYMNNFKTILDDTINKLCHKAKGILAADESIGTIGKRFADINVDNNLENRINYRHLLFNTPNLNKYISGVITFDETIKSTYNNITLIKPLLDNNILVGIKVDMKTKPLYGTDNETITQGLDNLDDRCKEYFNLGARFAKWRGVLKISDNCPSDLAIRENAFALARYASICQNNGIVPIVEPEILMDGNHNLETSKYITTKVLSIVYAELIRHNVCLKYTVLKPNMVRPGVNCPKKYSLNDIAYATREVLKDTVPCSVRGIFFLSGGLSEKKATKLLELINSPALVHHWLISFSYGRALQASVLKIWNGQNENIEEAQKMLLYRAYLNSRASDGYLIQESDDEDNENLHDPNYVY